MMDNELFELCEEVYKRTEWGVANAHEYIYQSYRDRSYAVFNEYKDVDDEYYEAIAPLYNSDYLLEKLPNSVSNGLLGVHCRVNAWMATYGGLTKVKYSGHSDTPLKALLKLVIALDDAGVKL